ncbi:MAG: type I-A CRISPR-associated protein Csa5 [Deltaproteobacteria bacterium]|nr:type I-A CRISPR-associated protein Csa5 [Deltaproteobacteria bacterium]MBW1978999.1 type I-A CRISPR-associated protein Csa5 [Deltaproteobacteria bacterium]MBW2045928.1 type I-A CRISPR-associated protein Csa5 [Deltaproteobacteria bacterium]MBW2300409.1 type I-A CRISPR-associated protein Csa5 [Deltaproteobacteria bacterium]
MITLYTPATGFPDLEAKIAYGLARVGLETYGVDKVTIQNDGGFYKVTFLDEGETDLLDQNFNLLCRRLLSSPFIPFNTPGIGGRSANSIALDEDQIFSLKQYLSIQHAIANRKNENVCKHKSRSTGNVIGLTALTSFHNKRDGLDVIAQRKNPRDKSSPKLPRRPTNPKNICKSCALLALLGTWYASFVFNVADREVISIPIPRGRVRGTKLRELSALQHQVRRLWINQKVPQSLIPFMFLGQIPSSARILDGFDLFMATLSGGGSRAYRVDGIFLITIDSYLKFLRANSYNIASIENMKRREAFGALQCLNDIIYYGKKDVLPKFARLYCQQTSSRDNKWMSMLYPETAFYLLKEVAMIDPGIIQNEAIASLARTLRYFVREKKYGYADSIRNARKESKDFEETVAKMLREARLRLEQNEKIHLPTDDEMKEIFRLADKDFDKTKTALVILAFSFQARSEENIETEKEVRHA